MVLRDYINPITSIPEQRGESLQERYDYIEGKRRIDEIMAIPNGKVLEDGAPSIEQLTFDKGFSTPVTAVFVEIQNSGKLFTDKRDHMMLKLVKAFTSEALSILQSGEDGKIRETGISGTSVYGIYCTPDTESKHDVYLKAYYINTLKYMLNSIYDLNKMPAMTLGIGIAASKDVVSMAGRSEETTGLLWMGRAVSTAARLSSLGNTARDPSKAGKKDAERYKTMVVTKEYYDAVKNMSRIREMFDKHEDPKLGTLYHGELVDLDFYNWIKNDMNRRT